MSKLFDNHKVIETPGTLPDKFAELFEPVKAHPGPSIWKGRKIDTTKITVEEARELVAENFSFLKYKEGKEPKPEASAADAKTDPKK